MNASHRTRARAGVALLVLGTACQDISAPVVDRSVPPSPPVAPPSTPPAAPPKTSPPPVPDPSIGALVYDEATAIYSDRWTLEYHGGSLASRFIFRTDSTFTLQFVSARYGQFEYGGRYTRADSTLTLSWDGSGSAGPWGATAVMRGSSILVKYNTIMALSDFVDGEYALPGSGRSGSIVQADHRP